MSNSNLSRIVESLKKNLDKLEAVILFGSRARGDWGPWSDYDLLIIDRANSTLTGIKIYRVSDHIPSPEYLESLPYKFSVEMKVFRGSKCILTITKPQENLSSLSPSDKIKEALAELVQKINKFLEEVKNEE